eukprot:CAMPEP_0181225920 /NCGR_PEP_ID=MMETSP1096-20121128/31967_1 /TAXON_ID=156174 ORGANISM="Chrysochromulina ericina, Strain CCMP281" /NCGR_SAMPLE_ID=MMETSP1096 /ASSEMBLY_ACC=CAM_ASM_000453 /LENGTH=84 /DNA_ID=CAMNT_0023319201 /DNA_START=170 /DNA_END=421 /DNA_ORIENTATION=+
MTPINNCPLLFASSTSEGGRCLIRGQLDRYLTANLRTSCHSVHRGRPTAHRGSSLPKGSRILAAKGSRILAAKGSRILAAKGSR